jgi:hypothetical protein
MSVMVLSDHNWAGNKAFWREEDVNLDEFFRVDRDLAPLTVRTMAGSRRTRIPVIS